MMSATYNNQVLLNFSEETESNQPLEYALRLTTSLISVESSWISSNVSHRGAVGLMQITQPALDDYNQKNKTQLTLTNMFDGKLNVKVGMWYFWERLVPYYNGDVKLALHSYNMGMGNLKKGKSNAIYVQRIMERKQNIK